MYVSNRSDQSVYFDNFKVQIAAGNLIEENHYYAYGLKIAAISSVKLGDGAEGGLKNNNQYQGAYSEIDADIGWNDFALRNYDAQTGRWVQQDPYQEYASPYVGMGNDPINNVDPDGGGVLGLTPGLYTLTTTLVGAVIGGDIAAAKGGSFFKGAAIGAAVGFAAGYIPSLVGGGVGKSLSHAVSILNISVKAVGIIDHITTQHNSSEFIINQLKAINQQSINSYNSFAGGIKSYNNPPGGYWQKFINGLKNDLTITGMTVNWFFGTAIYSKHFYNDRITDDLKNSAGITQARELFYKTGQTEGDYNFEKGGRGPIDAGSNPVAQFIGSFHYKISIEGKMLKFTVTNKTTLRSADYHMTPESWNPSNGHPMGDFSQVYTFTERLKK